MGRVGPNVCLFPLRVPTSLLDISSRFLLEIQVDVPVDDWTRVQFREEVGAEWTSGSHQHRDGKESLETGRLHSSGTTLGPGAPKRRAGEQSIHGGGRRMEAEKPTTEDEAGGRRGQLVTCCQEVRR